MKTKIFALRKARVETGGLQINDDWTGLFIRGDECFVLKDILTDIFYGHGVNEHDKNYLRKIINIINNDVKHK